MRKIKIVYFHIRTRYKPFKKKKDFPFTMAGYFCDFEENLTEENISSFLYDILRKELDSYMFNFQEKNYNLRHITFFSYQISSSYLSELSLTDISASIGISKYRELLEIEKMADYS